MGCWGGTDKTSRFCCVVSTPQAVIQCTLVGVWSYKIRLLSWKLGRPSHMAHTALQMHGAPCTGVSWRPAGATLVWLHHALASLDADLRSRHGPGARIVFRHGPYASSLIALADAAAAGAVHFSRRYEPAMQARARLRLATAQPRPCSQGRGLRATTLLPI